MLTRLHSRDRRKSAAPFARLQRRAIRSSRLNSVANLHLSSLKTPICAIQIGVCKSPFIIFEDADLDSAVEGLVDGIWFNQGQVCCAGSRLLMQESIAD